MGKGGRSLKLIFFLYSGILNYVDMWVRACYMLSWYNF